jgi:hypothetical protein
MFIPFLAAIGMSRSMSGGVSSGGGTTRSGAGSPTSLMNPSNMKRLEANQGCPSIGRLRDERMGHPLGPNANEPAGKDSRASPI